MRKGIRNARIVQLIGVMFLVAFVVSCSQARTEGGSFGTPYLLLGLLAIIGAKIYEWLSLK